MGQNPLPQVIPGLENVDYAAWYSPASSPGKVGVYQKMEIGVKVSDATQQKIADFLVDQNSGLNPFDPTDISIDITFHSPTKVVHMAHAFYFEQFRPDTILDEWVPDNTAFDWRIRFAPDEIGLWTAKVAIKLNDEIEKSFDFIFECAKSNHKGRLIRSYNENEQDRFLTYSKTGETFFGIGHNIAHGNYDPDLVPSENKRHLKWIDELASNGGTFTRLELGFNNGLPDWSDIRNYQSNMPQMQALDRVISKLEARDVYFILFRHHSEITMGVEWAGGSWQHNPYRTQLKLDNISDYFNNEYAKKWQKNALRYIFSRWGYSANCAVYQYQEIEGWIQEMADNEDIKQKEAIVVFRDWYLEMKAFIHNELKIEHTMFSCSYASEPKIEMRKNKNYLFANSDIVTLHAYGSADKGKNFRTRHKTMTKLWRKWRKPVIAEEIGHNAEQLALYCCSNYEFHNDIWSTAFSGGIGCGMSWWWDRGVHANDLHRKYLPMRQFFEGENLAKGKYNTDKWHDAMTIKRAKIQTYYLHSKDKRRALGYVHNATYNWKNIAEEDNCVRELIKDGHLSVPCEMEDGTEIGIDGSSADFNENGFSDVYENPIPTNGLREKGSIFKLKHLKSKVKKWYKPWGDKRWYMIVFYNTSDSILIFQSAQYVKPNIFGTIKPFMPETDDEVHAYAYKVFPVDAPADTKSLELLEEVTQTDTSNYITSSEEASNSEKTASIFPNPTAEELTVSSTQSFHKIDIYGMSGTIVSTSMFYPVLQYSFRLDLVPGIYTVHIYFNDGDHHVERLIVQ